MKRYFKIVWLLNICISSILLAQFQKVNSNGLEINYRIFGDGEPLLIIGGGPGDSSDRYISLCNLLSKNHKCILVDQRGTGKSLPAVIDSTTISIQLTLEDFESIKKKLGFEKWNVLGFSYGGYLASVYANFYPEAVKSLILLGSMGLNTDAFGYFFDNVKSRMKQSDLELLEFWSDSVNVVSNPKKARVEQIRSIMSGYFYDKEKSLIVSQSINSSSFYFEMGQWIWKDIQKRNLDVEKMKLKFVGPVLILHGRQDPLGELVAKNISEYYKKSKLIFVEKAGHYSWVEQPELILNEINKFIK